MNTKYISGILISAVFAITYFANVHAQETSNTTTQKAAVAPARVADAKKVDAVTTPDNVFFMTDGTWDKGVARGWAGFYVRNTPENTSQFLHGNTVVFKNGDKRTITGSSENGPYFDVRVSGDVLDSAKVGLPSTFKVTKAATPTQKDTKSSNAKTTAAPK